MNRLNHRWRQNITTISCLVHNLHFTWDTFICAGLSFQQKDERGARKAKWNIRKGFIGVITLNLAMIICINRWVTNYLIGVRKIYLNERQQYKQRKYSKVLGANEAHLEIVTLSVNKPKGNTISIWKSTLCSVPFLLKSFWLCWWYNDGGESMIREILIEFSYL